MAVVHHFFFVLLWTQIVLAKVEKQVNVVGNSSTEVDDASVEVEGAFTGPEDLSEANREALLIEPSNIFEGRRKRSIPILRLKKELSEDDLDEKAAQEIFLERNVKEKEYGPPAPPPSFGAVHPPAPPRDVPAVPATNRQPSQFSQAIISSGARVLPPVSTGLNPYDWQVDPDFPLAPPRARGLVNVPEGWNTNRQIDYEFKSGYRWRSAAPTGGASHRNFEIGLSRAGAPVAGAGASQMANGWQQQGFPQQQQFQQQQQQFNMQTQQFSPQQQWNQQEQPIPIQRQQMSFNNFNQGGGVFGSQRVIYSRNMRA